MKKPPTYRLLWILIFGGAAAGVAWLGFGRAYARRSLYAVASVAESERTHAEFVAILLPRITAGTRRHAMSAGDLSELLAGLTAEGYATISLEDVEALYRRERLLPAKAVLLAFADDNPRGVELADGVLKSLRMRATAFISRTALSADGDQRRFLTAHAVEQMRRGGAWSLGTTAGDRLSSESLSFGTADMGFNDSGDNPRRLRILELRSDRRPAENLRIVSRAWPRSTEFRDDFREAGLGADWVAGWGVVSRGRGRLALLPTPRQSGAGVFLRGTETWRDSVLEFELARYQREFWAYTRYEDDGGYLRVGAHDGTWRVEQKIGARGLPNLLARAPIHEDGLPARVRVVVKGGVAIVHANGRMLFGRSLRLAPSIAKGRIMMGVYDEHSSAARAVLTSVRATPLRSAWTAPRRAPSAEFDEARLEGLREEAVSSRALSPRWVTVGPEGSVVARETQGALVRSMAGFYGCRLVPMVEFPSGAAALTDPANAERAMSGLLDAARSLDAAALNLRLRGADAGRPATLSFLTRLRASLRARRGELWVTLDGAGATDAALTRVVDGVLRPAEDSRTDVETLLAVAR